MTQTLVSTWTTARARLQAAGVETPAFDARLLIEAGAAITRMDILTDPHRPLSDAQAGAIEKYLVRREAREPVAQILGKKHFWDFELVVTPAVLTPRPDTEWVVHESLNYLDKTAPARLLDLGTGSGAIALALLKERPRATALGIDASADALDVARFNAAALGFADRLELRQGDWGAGLEESSFDLVVSNPPYVRASVIETLAPEVARYEPRPALDGGPDGLAAYRVLAPQIARLLKPGGAFVLEIGQGQAEAVWAFAAAAGLTPDGVRDDFSGVPRVVYGRRS